MGRQVGEDAFGSGVEVPGGVDPCFGGVGEWLPAVVPGPHFFDTEFGGLWSLGVSVDGFDESQVPGVEQRSLRPAGDALQRGAVAVGVEDSFHDDQPPGGRACRRLQPWNCKACAYLDMRI
ncbi:hypothetical protein [Nocardia rhamnosiphila]